MAPTEARVLTALALLLGSGCRETPAPESSDPRPVALVAAQTTACVLTEAGRVYCWGAAGWGALGLGDRGVGSGCPESGSDACKTTPSCCIGDDEDPGAPGPVELGAEAVAIDAGDVNTCAITTDGDVHCWGKNLRGVLGLGSETPEFVGKDDAPADYRVELGASAIAISVGSLHACAITSEAALRCWGQGVGGALGYASLENVGDDETPSEMGDVELGGSVVAAYAGRDRSCAILEGGGVRCWGQNEFFAAGYEGGLTIGDDEHPAALPTLELGEPVVELALGAEHTCARTETGEVRCWGVIDMLGTSEASVSGRSAAASVPVALGKAAITIAAGASHTCAVLDDGSLRCWGEAPEVGYASLEFVGDDETPASMGPVELGEPVRAVAAGAEA